MTREQLAHLIRAACSIADDPDVLPAGWERRLVPFDRDDVGAARAMALDPHDLVVSKLYAGRTKDIAFAAALLRESMISVAVLAERAATLDAGPERDRLRDLIAGLRPGSIR